MFPNTSKTLGIFVGTRRRSRIQWSSAAVSISLCQATVSSEHEERLWKGVPPPPNFGVKNSQKYIWERQSWRHHDISWCFNIFPGIWVTIIRVFVWLLSDTLSYHNNPGASPAAMSYQSSVSLMSIIHMKICQKTSGQVASWSAIIAESCSPTFPVQRSTSVMHKILSQIFNTPLTTKSLQRKSYPKYHYAAAGTKN